MHIDSSDIIDFLRTRDKLASTPNFVDHDGDIIDRPDNGAVIDKLEFVENYMAFMDPDNRDHESGKGYVGLVTGYHSQIEFFTLGLDHYDSSFENIIKITEESPFSKSFDNRSISCDPITDYLNTVNALAKAHAHEQHESTQNDLARAYHEQKDKLAKHDARKPSIIESLKSFGSEPAKWLKEKIQMEVDIRCTISQYQKHVINKPDSQAHPSKEEEQWAKQQIAEVAPLMKQAYTEAIQLKQTARLEAVNEKVAERTKQRESVVHTM